MDKLLEIAEKFEKLLGIEYNFILGKNKKLYNLRISFSKLDFYHLAGLHKLNDLVILHKNATAVFADIKKGKITWETIRKSRHFGEIEGRLHAVGALEEFLDTVAEVYKYDIRKACGSRIQADYLLRNKILESIGFLFLVKNDELYVGSSFFLEDKKDYTRNQMKLCLLEKDKFSKKSNVNLLLYKKENFTTTEEE